MKAKMVITILNVGGAVLGIVGSIVQSIAADKKMKATIAEEVTKAVTNQNN